MNIQYNDENDELFIYTGRLYMKKNKEKAQVPAKENYEPSDKKRIKSKDDYQEQRKLKRGEQ